MGAATTRLRRANQKGMHRRVPLLSGLALLAGCGGPDMRNVSANEVADQLSDITIAPGAWEVASEVVRVSAPNLPIQARDQMIGPRPPVRGCLTPEQAARPDARFLAGQGRRGCAYSDFAMRNGRLTGTMHCPERGGGTTVARMTGDYRHDRYALAMTIETPMPDGAMMRIETRTVGRRTGDCPGGAAP